MDNQPSRTAPDGVARCTPQDAPALAAVWATYGGDPVGPEAFVAALERDPAEAGCLLARRAGVPVAYASYALSRRRGDPAGKYWVYAVGLEAETGALYEPVLLILAALGGRSVYTMAQEGEGTRRALLAALGFREVLRSYGADLEVASVNASTYGDPEAQLAARGVRIKTLAELRRDPAHAAGLTDGLYDLYLDTNRDIPEVGHDDTRTRADFEAHLARPDLLPDAYFVAVQEGAGEDTYIGYSELFAASTPDALRQEATAVRRSHRRQGVALALKLRGLRYARTHGATTINTGMAADNVPMVALNTRLGFVAQPAYLTFCKEL